MKTIVIDGVEYTLTPAEEENEIIQKKKILQDKNYRVDSSTWKVSPFDNRIKISPCRMASEIIKGKLKGEQHFSYYYLLENSLLEKIPTENQLQKALENGELLDAPISGYFDYQVGVMYYVGLCDYLWSSSLSGSFNRILPTYNYSSGLRDRYMTYWFSVRLLAD